MNAAEMLAGIVRERGAKNEARQVGACGSLCPEGPCVESHSGGWVETCCNGFDLLDGGRWGVKWSHVDGQIVEA